MELNTRKSFSLAFYFPFAHGRNRQKCYLVLRLKALIASLALRPCFLQEKSKYKSILGIQTAISKQRLDKFVTFFPYSFSFSSYYCYWEKLSLTKRSVNTYICHLQNNQKQNIKKQANKQETELNPNQNPKTGHP